jgi:hypothetical protein
MTYRILVTGWRDWPKEDAWWVWDKLYWAYGRFWYMNSMVDAPVIVRHGDCPYGGVDRWAGVWARHNEHIEDPHPAPWKELGKAAGNVRNSHMVNLGADVCLAFPGPGSKGTIDCLNKAREAGIETFVFPWEDVPRDL